MSTVVVAGGSGFVGRHVVAELVAAGHEVRVLDRGRRSAVAGARHFRCDLAREAPPADAFRWADVIVNLVGIKRAAGGQTFEDVHVGAVRRLVSASKTAGIHRFVHLSVVGSRPDPVSPYRDTKWRAEEELGRSRLEVTILRPAVIYGAGDDMITHLVKMIRCAAVFPIVGSGATMLQAVDVRDVAAAVRAAVERPETAGRTYDVVGPERLSLRQIVETTAQGLELSLTILPTSPVLLRPIVALMSRLSSATLSTPAQLRMLQEGLVGDPKPARRDLVPIDRRFTVDTVRNVATEIPPLFGVSARLAPSSAHRQWLRGLAGGAAGALVIAALAIAAPLLLASLVPNVWYRLAVIGVTLAGLSAAIVPLPWRELLVWRWREVGQGLLAAVVLYGVSFAVARLLGAVPGVSAQIASVYAWKQAVPSHLMLPLLVLIIAAEEVVWRLAVALPLAGRLGPVRGLLTAAALGAAAHLWMPAVVPLAAFGAGVFWAALVVRTRRVVPAFVCHLAWDVSVLLLWPLGG